MLVYDGALGHFAVCSTLGPTLKRAANPVLSLCLAEHFLNFDLVLHTQPTARKLYIADIAADQFIDHTYLVLRLCSPRL